MTGQDLLVGLIGLALLPLIGLRLWRGLRDGRVPLYRTYVERADGASKFNLLVALHALTLLVVALIAADLLLGLGLRQSLPN